MSVKDKLQELIIEAKEQIALVKSVHELNDVKAKYLGKKGSFQEIMKLMKDLPNEERPTFGKLTNEAKQVITAYLNDQKQAIEDAKVNEQLRNETIDVTLPGRSFEIGKRHLLTQIKEELEDLFIGMGYSVMEGPEVEIDELTTQKKAER